jgi:hypothetical protein
VPYSDLAKAREAKRLSAQRRRAKATEDQQKAERKANADQMARKRAVNGYEPGNPFAETTGTRSDVATWEYDSDSAVVYEVADGIDGDGETVRRRTAKLAPLLEEVSAWTEPRWWSYERDGCEVIGRPRWWQDGNEYRGDERRWVLYSIRLAIETVRQEHRSNPRAKPLEDGRATEDEGRAAEARGSEIWSVLYSESQDVRRAAEWLRDGRKSVPDASFTRARVTAALERLRALGLYRRVGRGEHFRIQ